MVTLSSYILLDSSIFIDHLRNGLHQQRIASLTGLLRNSAVVLAELWRGADKPPEIAYLRALEKNYPILVPTGQNWMDSGKILRTLRRDHGFTREKLRALHFDILIALTARSHGALLITSNRVDFEIIASHKSVRGLSLEIW